MGRLTKLLEPTRLKRSAAALIVILVVTLGALAMRATIDAEAARHEIEAALGTLTGRPIRLQGSSSVRILPWPSVRFFDVTLADADRTFARMGELDADLDVAALLLGRLRPTEILLARPEILVTGDLPLPSIAAVAAWLARLETTSIVIEKGRIAFAHSSGEEILDGVDARLSWPRPSANAIAGAAFRWRGESVTIDAETPSPATLVAAGNGPLGLRLSSGPLRITLAGTGGLLGETRFEGTVDIDVTDAARFARWSGRPRIPDLLAGRLRLDSRATVDAAGATLPTVRVDLAGNKGEGALTWRWDQPRSRLAGTIAFTDLDLASDRRRPLAAGWRALPLGGDAPVPDLDLRLSTPTLRLPGAVLTRVAAALHIADGRLHAEIGNAEYLDRPLSLVVRGRFDRDGLDAQVRATGDDLPLAAPAALLDLPGLEGGRASAAIEAETRCAELGACLAGLDGRLAVEARAVVVTGASPFADISRFRPIVPQTNGTRVTTIWDRASVDMRFSGPRVDVRRIEIAGQGARFDFVGTGDLATGALDLTGHARFPAFHPDPSRTGSTEVSVPMRVGGTIRRLEAMARDATPANGAPPPVAP